MSNLCRVTQGGCNCWGLRKACGQAELGKGEKKHQDKNTDPSVINIYHFGSQKKDDFGS